MSTHPPTALAPPGSTRPADGWKASDLPTELRVPAQPEYVSSLRLLAGALGARSDLTLDDIEDLRVAVDEACALLLPHTQLRQMLTARFMVRPWRLDVEVTVPVQGHPSVDRSGYAWIVLSAVVGRVGVVEAGGSLTLRLTKRREARGEYAL